MQSLRSLLVPAVLTFWTCLTAVPAAAASTADSTSTDARFANSATGVLSPQGGQRPQGNGSRRRGGGRRGRRGITVIEAGMVHPVAGPPIKNGVVVVRGERILAIGKQGDLQLPPNSTVHKFPEGHVYPGLIDASTDAFTDAGLQSDGSLNGGNKISEGLVWSGKRDDHLVQHGITTAYINVRSGAQLGGQGAIVRPRKDGFELWEDREQAAMQLKMSTGRSNSHPLQRQQRLESVSKLFDGLDEYREAQEKFEEELEKYSKDFEKYLEHHSKKNGKDKKDDAKKNDADGKKGADKAKSDEAAAKPETARRRNGRRGGGGRPPRREPPKKDGASDQGKQLEDIPAEVVEQALATMLALTGTPAAGTPAAGTPAAGTPAAQDPRPSRRRPQGRPSTQGAKPASSAKAGAKPTGKDAKKDDGPKRPKYPKRPREDEQKEALNKVLDGDLPLRIEAHRHDELRAALRLKQDKEIPLVVLEQAYAAGRMTEEIAEAGATVVLTDLLVNSLGMPGDKRNPYAAFDPTALPHKLNEAGIAFAIASGKARLSPLLPLMAASAVGRGLSPEAALRAITLTPAEVLGIAADTGSLARGKFADCVVTSGPLFQSDSRVLLVMAKGRTEYEAK